MNMKVKSVIAFFCLLLLSACVTVEPEPPVIINGAAGYLEKVNLPQGSSITIAVIDLDTPGAIIAQKSFNIARAPVPFKFTFDAETIDSKVNYGVVAMIQYQGKVIFQTYDKFPVINNGKFTTEVLMKLVNNR
ncbi:chaperone for general secretion pathway YbaY [Shewanella colwelliana]|uniref:Chaperone for general secretion pathway YbaY n=1 Tax=Shewanella colwelliana TaxID=23 RepID=A0A1E5IXY6_SHECO|nr:YbaY family lipoprotein [Shewanella colwelliana]MDX1281200.1 YbaY family lipoprotein [Shewanella colwelliana]OEG75410.1 chaperone for general secretion pathway YbaY [Shewanella colwelliana]GIU22764.1 chaperone for general secretion pathway YbaY [Shewanella colwelliana]GIU35946.1 chaperone for general secretion pathway YbaY [Shewanella colwelliana]